ncbi:MAG: sugar transferase [Actinomycetota bacterium]|nr:sugar transferase [Actinomycetota bacterium]MDP2287469.1 sugar transferase [Actinomycetota bacterium]
MKGWYSAFGKRLFDLIAGLILFVLTLPLLAITGLLVRLKLGRPVLFRQERPGKGGRSFTLAKFRTMLPATSHSVTSQDDAERMTGFGRVLRSTSLDELPELYSVIKGDMSLVGPRPLLTEYLPRYSQEQARRHDVRPGLTGLAQVSGRNAVNWPERLAMDVWYVDNLSLKLDLSILWRTVRAVVRREGTSAEGQATMAPFQGNEQE